ncbi:GNAT family N-acetyltransferase [Actinoplanes sp. NPDC051411]|uniref:GNAT family N-acetyltransferase n=1 Tax=Actinoplanes sp. NPDC051411 TaxID=3155522 RepID=UPI0034458292
MQPIIRGYRPSDLDALYDICIRTADAGADLSGRFGDDRLIGDIYAAPYVTLEPDVARILDDGDGNAIGYILGTADTPEFVRRYETEWLPQLGDRYRDDDDPRDQSLLKLLRWPQRMLMPELAEYPAHLHIDLLPQARGHGEGRALMTSFLRGLHAAGVERVHLSMAPANTGARAFYDRLGFTEIPMPPGRGGLYLGRSTEI